MAIDLSDLSEVVTLSTRHPSEAPTLLGKSFVTPWFSMDADRSAIFEKATYLDDYPHPYGGAEGYGEDLVEGYHLLGMLDYLFNHALWSEGPWIAWNYGLDNVRFVSVVRHDDRFRIRGTITQVIDRGRQGHLLVIDCTAEVAARERPGFVATQRVLWASPTS
ncbi:hotdog family protein [Nonomuraea turcica]|uniref:MaoC/PaaZ C-terminal domain-containing protein n=1 Tax=Nonomuraea sp. G32 TaxID=3067274 RepID=UPI00273C519C|nr:MaoC/PaaZ C-terminal domain-containing protein [Nonomuraea sp. G32]MDP4502541.1 MaoC/PaaZ C-terminal domain-containing protein [Nonomuraea sp. G32]